MAARAVGAFATAGVSTFLLRRLGYRLPMIVGFLLVSLGMVMISITPLAFGAYWWVAVFSLMVGFGVGCAAPATNNATLQLAPDHIAAIMGLRGMFRQLGGIIYVSIATGVARAQRAPGHRPIPHLHRTSGHLARDGRSHSPRPGSSRTMVKRPGWREGLALLSRGGRFVEARESDLPGDEHVFGAPH